VPTTGAGTVFFCVCRRVSEWPARNNGTPGDYLPRAIMAPELLDGQSSFVGHPRLVARQTLGGCDFATSCAVSASE
jgi:hypothetical protein